MPAGMHRQAAALLGWVALAACRGNRHALFLRLVRSQVQHVCCCGRQGALLLGWGSWGSPGMGLMWRPAAATSVRLLTQQGWLQRLAAKRAYACGRKPRATRQLLQACSTADMHLRQARPCGSALSLSGVGQRFLLCVSTPNGQVHIVHWAWLHNASCCAASKSRFAVLLLMGLGLRDALTPKDCFGS